MSTQKPSNEKREKRSLSVLDIAQIGCMIATLEAGKQALAFLPNVEIVTLLIIMYTIFFGGKIFFAIPVFVFIEGCLFGFREWWLSYLYVWPLLALITLLNRKRRSIWFFSLLSGLFGLFFGALCAIPYLLIGGPSVAFAWWIAGIPFDCIHAVANFVLCLALYYPLLKILEKVKYRLMRD